jgi:hypothetical protein
VNNEDRRGARKATPPDSSAESGFDSLTILIRVDFPEAFERMSKQERKMNVKILDVFLDELDPSAGNYRSEFETECGVTCTAFQHSVQWTKERL